MPFTRSESPVPRLSNMITRPSEESPWTYAANWGCSHASSTFETKPGTTTTSSAPSP